MGFNLVVHRNEAEPVASWVNDLALVTRSGCLAKNRVLLTVPVGGGEIFSSHDCRVAACEAERIMRIGGWTHVKNLY